MNDSLYLYEIPLYGSSRLGVIKENKLLMTKLTQNNIGVMSLPIPVNSAMSKNALKQSIYPLGKKHYESTDWLGNVRVTYTDKKSWNNGKFALNVSSSLDYYPFGSVMEGRNLEISNYRFGFQGQEKIDEIVGSGNHYTTFFRELDVRTAQWWSLDPKPHASWSPIVPMSRNPVFYTDPLGDTVRYNSFRDRLKVGVNSLFNKEFRADLKELKSSEETYVFKGSDQLNGGGYISTDGDDIFINYSWNSKDRTLGTGRATSLFHETEHAIQFEHGEFGFMKTNSGDWIAVNYDLTDEMGALRAGSFAPGSILKDYNGRNTFQGDMRSLGTNMSNPTVVQNNTSVILRYYQNQPNATYNKLPQTPLNNTQINTRLKNGKYFMRPFIPRGR